MLLLAVHALILFLPPFGPQMKGPLVSWAAGYAAVLMLLVELARRRAALLDRWAAIPAGRRRALGLGLALAALLAGLAIRALAPALFGVLSAEYGLFEPANVLCYFAGAIVLFAVSAEAVGRQRKHWVFLAALYVLAGLEEIDYLGIFGRFVGRIDGVYAGSLHDLIRLTTEGVLQLPDLGVAAAIALAVAGGLCSAGYLQPRQLLSLVRSRQFLWVAAALGLMLVGAADDAHAFGWQATPSYEEILELSAAICLLVYSLQLTTSASGSASGSA